VIYLYRPQIASLRQSDFQALSDDSAARGPPAAQACQSGAKGVADPGFQETVMGINDERDIEANLQIGPTDQGMVRLFIEAQGIEVPMDFDPDEAEDIAEEIRAAAAVARARGS
jgi:hypothetical protein